jgi:hypothetical protein
VSCRDILTKVLPPAPAQAPSRTAALVECHLAPSPGQAGPLREGQCRRRRHWQPVCECKRRRQYPAAGMLSGSCARRVRSSGSPASARASGASDPSRRGPLASVASGSHYYRSFNLRCAASDESESTLELERASAQDLAVALP